MGAWEDCLHPGALAALRAKRPNSSKRVLSGYCSRRELVQALSQRLQETLCIGIALKAGNQIIGKAHDDRVSRLSLQGVTTPEDARALLKLKGQSEVGF